MTTKSEKDQREIAAKVADEFEQEVQRRCHAQIPIDELAAKLNCSEELLKQRFGGRLEQWRKQGLAMARQELFWAACSGKISALIFFLKSYGGLGEPTPRAEPENPVRTYKVSLRQMSKAELDAEKKRHSLACETHIGKGAGAEGGRGEVASD